MRAYCHACHERRKAMTRVFCWLPTKVYLLDIPYMRTGFRWLTRVLRGSDGKHYVEAP